jgi:uncharacterized protein (TIGR03000 family)
VAGANGTTQVVSGGGGTLAGGAAGAAGGALAGGYTSSGYCPTDGGYGSGYGGYGTGSGPVIDNVNSPTASSGGSSSTAGTTPAAPVADDLVAVADPVPAAVDDTAWLTFELPTLEAKVWIDGVEVTAKGQIRKFVTPVLTAKKTYGNSVKFTWVDKAGKTQTHTKDFTFVAGDDIYYIVPATDKVTTLNTAPMPKAK